MKKFFLISLMALTCGVMAFAGNGEEKFFLGVTSGNTVGATVLDGMNLLLQVPEDGTVSLTGVTVEMRMQNVPALGVTTPRSQVVTLSTGLSGEVDLKSWFANAYNFNGAPMVVSVKAKGATQSFLYNFGGIVDGVIAATPNSEIAAKAAWELIAAQVTAETKTAEDSYILVKAGSFIQLGGEKLIFNQDHEILKGNWGTEGGLQGAVERLLAATEVIGNAGEGNIIFIAKGSVLAVGNSMATTKDDVTMTLVNDAEEYPFEGFLSETYEKMEQGDLSDAIKAIVNFCNKIVGYVDNAETVNYLTINVGEGEEEGEELAPEEAAAPVLGEKTLIRGGMTPGNYYTVCLPYGVNSYVGGTFYEINQKVGAELELISVSSLEPGKPYVCIPTAAEVEGYFNDNYSDMALTNRGLIGTFQQILVPVAEGNFYVFGDHAIQPCASICFLAANRAYVDMDEVEDLIPHNQNQAAGRRRVVVGPHHAPTALEAIEAENFNGKKVIVNGQLLIIRDGVKYNAQGAIVK